MSELVSVKYAIVADGIFLAGKNLGTKLDVDATRGLDLKFDEDKKRLIVKWNNEVAYCYAHSYWVPGEAKKLVNPTALGKKIAAQVSTPQDHVFAGAGAGDTGIKPKMKF